MRFLGQPWTPDQVKLLMDLRAKGVPYAKIVAATGHSIGSCMATYSTQRRKVMGEDPGKRWRSDEVALLLKMAAVHISKKRRILWPEIAVVVGHLVRACRAKHKYETEKAVNQKLRQEVAAPPPKPPRSEHPISQGPLPKRSYEDLSRPTSLAGLMTHAMIRDRIGAQGITAGLLGDPPPGRSALDQKRSGLAEAQASPSSACGFHAAPTRINGHRIPPTVTLATEPPTL